MTKYQGMPPPHSYPYNWYASMAADIGRIFEQYPICPPTPYPAPEPPCEPEPYNKNETAMLMRVEIATLLQIALEKLGGGT